LACILVVSGFIAFSSSAENQRGMVSSVHPMATEAGLNVLKSGGNAIDAAVAVGLTLGVVDTPNAGIGGGCFMLIRLANGKFVAIDGRETAPAAAARDMFVRNGKGDTDLSQTGALASGVPGELAAFDYAVRKYGRKTLSELILPAAQIAENGFPLTASYASRLRAEAKDMEKFEASRAVFFKDGQLLQAGDLLKQPDLGATYRAIAGPGSGWFYRGAFAEAMEKWMKGNGGIMSAADFANYQIKLREPVTTTYRGYKIVSFAPPSSGGVHLVQMLNILEKFDLKSLDEATRLHVIAEAMKLAFADRAHWLGDPDFARVPRGLVSKNYAASLAKRINLDRTI
jgi:gamma-glutamyltranspeptidase/glutathione hydrolase